MGAISQLPGKIPAVSCFTLIVKLKTVFVPGNKFLVLGDFL
jgi:hypothetical protein